MGVHRRKKSAQRKAAEREDEQEFDAWVAEQDAAERKAAAYLEDTALGGTTALGHAYGIACAVKRAVCGNDCIDPVEAALVVMSGEVFRLQSENAALRVGLRGQPAPEPTL